MHILAHTPSKPNPWWRSAVGRSSEGSGGLTGIEEHDEGQRRERPECTVEAVEAPDTPPRLSSEEKSPRTTLEGDQPCVMVCCMINWCQDDLHLNTDATGAGARHVLP
jgi:hypothetical protein